MVLCQQVMQKGTARHVPAPDFSVHRMPVSGIQAVQRRQGRGLNLGALPRSPFDPLRLLLLPEKRRMRFRMQGERERGASVGHRRSSAELEPCFCSISSVELGSQSFDTV